MAPLRYASKFDHFLSPTPSTLAISKKRKGSNFAIWQPWYQGHYDLTNHFAISENESKARVKFSLMEAMLQPCGPPTEKRSED